MNASFSGTVRTRPTVLDRHRRTACPLALDVGDARYQPSKQRPRAIRSGPPGTALREPARRTSRDFDRPCNDQVGVRRTGRRRPSRSSARATTRSPGRTRSSSEPRTDDVRAVATRDGTTGAFEQRTRSRVRGRVRRFTGSLAPGTAPCPTSPASSSARAPVTQ